MKHKKQPSKIFISTYDTPSYPSGFEPVLYKDVDNIPDHSLEEIFLIDLLDNFPDPTLSSVLSSIAIKLKAGGSLHIQSLDFEQFCTYVSLRTIDISAKNLLYETRKNVHTMSIIEKLLNDPKLKLKIVSKKYINGIEYYIKAEQCEHNDE